MGDETLTLRIYSFGPPEIRLGGSLLTFPTRKTQALLLYLAIEAGLQQREHLATLFWPEASPERSHGNLRNTLRHLQRSLRNAAGVRQLPYLNVSHNSISLNFDTSVSLDLSTIEAAYAQARSDRSSRIPAEGTSNLPLFQAAAAFQRGEFLAGFSLGDAPEFDDWVASQREVWHRRLGLVLDRLTEILFTKGDFSSATDVASRWIAIDTLNELAYRRKMRAHFAAGERGQALETYEACRLLFAAELDIEPEPDTIALVEQIRSQPHALPSAGTRAALQSRHSDTSVAFLGKLFAGRVQEYQTLTKTYALAAAGQPQIVILRGDAGIGKTRLATKFTVWAKGQNAELLHGNAYESGSYLPFQPLVDAIRRRLEAEKSPRDLLDDSWVPALSRLLPELQMLSQESPSLPDQAANSSASQLFEPFAQLTMKLAKRSPLVIFIDDVQWIDSVTLDFLQYAVRRWQVSVSQENNTGASRILLLLSLRSTSLLPYNQPTQDGGSFGLAEWIERVSRDLPPVHIALEPLGKLDTLQMISSILAPPAADFGEWLYSETNGHPFYLVETLKDLLERHILHPKHRGPGDWVFSVDAVHNLGQAVRVPSTVHAVIRSRMNRLSPDALSLLTGSAVLDQPVTFEHVCGIVNLGADLALPALDELLSGRLLLEVVQEGKESKYVLVNDMLRDVIYTEAGDARRRTYHRRALEILATARESSAVLAHHAFAAGIMPEAFHYSLAAGQEALHLLALGAAVTHFERAQQAIPNLLSTETLDKGELEELYTQLKLAYELSGKPEKALSIAAEHDLLGL